jgi:hypothetical protein
MSATARAVLAAVLVTLSARSAAWAQPFEGPGARAQGMAAFVAVADDASAVYWNPAGLATGAYFSLVLDRTEAETLPEGADRGDRRSGWMLALSAPAVGLSYYRLRWSTVAPAVGGAPGESRVESLVTHHVGATLVQTIVEGLVVGTTLKAVRGVANAGVGTGDPEELMDALPLREATSRFDADAGVMFTTGSARFGLTARNLTRPEFESPGNERLRLDRQLRAGAAVLLTPRWTAALDVDLTRNRAGAGDVRALAVGTEGRLTVRALARAGLSINTAPGADRSPVASVGGSFAVFGSLLVDAHASTGGAGAKGWGVAGRVVF